MAKDRNLRKRTDLQQIYNVPCKILHLLKETLVQFTLSIPFKLFCGERKDRCSKRQNQTLRWARSKPQVCWPR